MECYVALLMGAGCYAWKFRILQIPEPLQDKFTMANMASACALVVSEEKSFDPVRSWTTKTAATTCAFVSVSVISICIMVVCGVFIVREYALSKSYKRNHCWVEDISYLDVKDCNFCPGHKTKEKNSASCIQSKFPCVQVTVAYEIDGTKREGLLHSSSIEASGLFSQCSHQVCMKDFEASKKAIEQYLERWKNLMVRHLDHHNAADSTESKHIFVHSLLRHIFDLKTSNNNQTDLESEPGLNSSRLQLAKMKNKVRNTTHHFDINDGYFRCFVNELDPHDVIEYKNYTKSDVIHCMLWPALVVLLCCCAFLYIEASRRSLTFCGQKERPSDHVNFPEGRGFLPSGKVKVLDRSHFISRGLDEHLKSDRSRESEAYVKKANKTYPVKSRLLEERGKTDVSDEDKVSHLCSSGRSSRPEVLIQTS